MRAAGPVRSTLESGRRHNRSTSVGANAPATAATTAETIVHPTLSSAMDAHDAATANAATITPEESARHNQPPVTASRYRGRLIFRLVPGRPVGRPGTPDQARGVSVTSSMRKAVASWLPSTPVKVTVLLPEPVIERVRCT